MAVLARAAALACLASCYSPELRDCTVTCESSAECAGAQVCGTDHLCARPATAGTCARMAEPDAGATLDAVASDAALADAAAPVPDAPATGTLELQVVGRGQLIAGGRSCSAECMFDLPLVPIDVVAVAGGDQAFDRWTIGPCVGSTSTTCTVTPPVTVGVRFHKGDH